MPTATLALMDAYAAQHPFHPTRAQITDRALHEFLEREAGGGSGYVAEGCRRAVPADRRDLHPVWVSATAFDRLGAYTARYPYRPSRGRITDRAIRAFLERERAAGISASPASRTHSPAEAAE